MCKISLHWVKGVNIFIIFCIFNIFYIYCSLVCSYSAYSAYYSYLFYSAARIDDGDEIDDWVVNDYRTGNPMPLTGRADRWYQRAPTADPNGKALSGDVSGIRINIWNRAKVRRLLTHNLVGGGSQYPYRFSHGDTSLFSRRFKSSLFIPPNRHSVLGRTYGTYLHYERSYAIIFFWSFGEPRLRFDLPAKASVFSPRSP